MRSRPGPWDGNEDVGFATLDRVASFDGGRPLEPLGHVRPIEFGETCYGRQGLSDGHDFTGSTRDDGRVSA